MGQLKYAEQVAASLQKDPLFIDPAVAADVRDRTQRTIEDELAAQPDDSVPVYVIITEPGQVEDLGIIAHAALDDKDSIILTLSPASGGVHATVNVPDADRAEYQARIDAASDDSGDPPPTEVVGILRSLRDEGFESEGDHGSQIQHDPAPRTEVVDPSSGLAAALVLVPLLLVIAAVAAAAVARRRRTRATGYRLPKQMLQHARRLQTDSLRRELAADSLRIAERLKGFDTGALTAGEARRVEHGLDAYALAGRIVDDPAAHSVELAGALVLLTEAARDLDAVETSTAQAQAGSAALRRLGRQRQPRDRAPRRLCAFDPTHGEADRDLPLPELAGSQRLPACADCAGDIEAGRSPDWLYDGAAPYVEAHTIWARTLFGTVGDDLVTQLQRENPGRQRG